MASMSEGSAILTFSIDDISGTLVVNSSNYCYPNPPKAESPQLLRTSNYLILFINFVPARLRPRPAGWPGAVHHGPIARVVAQQAYPFCRGLRSIASSGPAAFGPAQERAQSFVECSGHRVADLDATGIGMLLMNEDVALERG